MPKTKARGKAEMPSEFCAARGAAFTDEQAGRWGPCIVRLVRGGISIDDEVKSIAAEGRDPHSPLHDLAEWDKGDDYLRERVCHVIENLCSPLPPLTPDDAKYKRLRVMFCAESIQRERDSLLDIVKDPRLPEGLRVEVAMAAGYLESANGLLAKYDETWFHENVK